MPRPLLITGTDTGIGKTTVASAIAAAFRGRGIDVGIIKPVETGCEPDPGGVLNAADALQLRWAAGRDDALERVCPYRFRAPLAPSVAARLEGVTLRLSDIVESVRAVVATSEVALVEGAGGLLVPLTDAATFADLARECGLRLLVVVGNRLGAVNHARLTLDWARMAKLDVAGYVVNTLRPDADLAAETNVETLRQFCGPGLGVFPYIGQLGRSDADRRLLAETAERTLRLDALLK